LPVKSQKRKKKYKRKVNWKEYNESLVRRGELLFDSDFLSNWRAELREMNKEKEGARFRYPNSLIWLLATVHAYLFPYRELEGFLRAISVHIKELKRVPDFTTMWWRVSRIKVKLDPYVHLKEDIVIAVDSTGIKVANRGEWIRRHECSSSTTTTRKGFIKIHVAVDTRSKLILSIKVTKEDVGDGRMLKSLVRDTITNVQQTNIRRVLADGAYDSRDNFQFLHDSDIDPAIKVRKNSSIKSMGCYARKMIVLQQLGDPDKWKHSVSYGRRWAAESVFSSMKRMFGEHVISIKWKNIVNELLMKAYMYNMFMKITL
jgi:Transposase DDE domain